MAIAQKQPSEEEFNKFKEALEKKLSEELKAEPKVNMGTRFARYEKGVLKFGETLSKLKDSNEIIRVNQIGLGLENEWIPPKMKFYNISYELLELLNQVRNVGLEPKQVIFYAADIEPRALFHTKSMETLWMPAYKESDKYFRNFFPDLHRIDGDTVSIDIPEDWRKRVVYLKLNILEQPAPVKAHITFSLIPDLYEKPEYLENLVASTRRGGYLFCSAKLNDEILKNLNVEVVSGKKDCPTLFHLK
jgi:hypothetical protein